MRMDRQRDIFRQRSHFNRENALCNQFSGACADDAYTQHTFALRIENQLGHSFRSVEGHRSPRGRPGKFRDFNFAVLFLRLSLGEATPGNYGIGKNNRGNGTWLKCNFVTCDRFDCGAPFMRSLVRQHGLPGHVADGVDHRIIRLQLLVYLDEPAWADPHLSFFKPRNLGVRFASHGDQNLVENSSARSVLLTRKVFEFSNAACPCTYWTLRCFESTPRPPVSFLTTSSFQARRRETSIFGSPNSTPQFFACCDSAISLATCRSDLEGMHPRYRQTPPGFNSGSISVTFNPKSAARKAAA